MQLIYYRSAVPNFGDDLNAILWQTVCPELFGRNSDAGFVGIGTIIGMPCKPDRLHVFSSGVGNDLPNGWAAKQVQYWCVRGPISAKVLGLSEDRAITDGAILSPLVEGFPESGEGQSGTLIIPHFQTLEYGGWTDVARLTGYELLDPRAEPQAVARRISTAKLVLTESLHGAIMADVYGVPWAVFSTSGNFGIPKWVDWCLSMNLPFELAMVPPPTSDPIIRYGRAAAPFGSTVSYDAEAALSQFRHRVSRPSVKSMIKSRLKQLPGVARLAASVIDASSDRTAESLVRLAQSHARLSSDSLRADRRAQMLERLAVLRAQA